MEFKDFELPKDGNFTDDEVKGLKALGAYIKSQFESIAAGIKSPETIAAEVKSEFEKCSFSGDKLKKLEDALMEQGREITMLKNTTANTPSDSLDAQIKAFITNADNINAHKKQQPAFMEIPLKEAGTMLTSGAVKPAIDVWNVGVDRTIHSAPTEPNAIYSRLLKGSTSFKTLIWVNRVDGDGGAAWIQEGQLKPLMDWGYETETATVRKVAVSAKVSTEMLQDAPFMRAQIDQLLREDLLNKVNKVALTGKGDNTEILGVATNAGGYVITDLNGKVEMPNYGDVVRAAMLQMRLLNFTPNTLFLNPVDKTTLDLTKDSTGHYISDEINRLMAGLQIVETTNIDPGKFLLMDTRKWNILVYDQFRLEYGLENDDFRKNLVTVIAEMRLMSYQNSIDAGSVIYDSFATVQAAIEKSSDVSDEGGGDSDKE